MIAAAGVQLRVWRCAVLLVTLLAFCWQSQVTQTHLHFRPDRHPAALAATGGSAHQQALGRSSADLSADCLICSELAHAGHYVAPSPVSFAVPQIAAVWPGATVALQPAISHRSHAWRSRAPPHNLPA